jgi:hypothetical protein
MQGHVKIADEMDEIAGSVGAGAWISILVFENGELAGDGLGDTAVVAAELREWNP